MSKGRFDYVAFDEMTIGRQNILKELIEGISDRVEFLTERSREQALALTKLEEAWNWIGKALRNDQIERQAREVAGPPT